jgi:type I restriction enzyme, S subunit
LLSSTLLSDVAHITTPKHKVANQLIRKDILLSTRGTIGQTEFISASARKQVRAMNVIVRRQSDEVTPEYLLFVLSSQSFQIKLRKITKGVSIPFVSNRDLGNISIPIIPISQQKKKGEAFMKLFTPYQKALKKYDSAKEDLGAAKSKLVRFR